MAGQTTIRATSRPRAQRGPDAGQGERTAEHLAAVRRQSPAHLRQGARLSRRGVRRRGTRAPRRLQRAQTQLRKGGDHWEAKDQRGRSDDRAESGGPNAKGDTAEGVDANSTKKHLMEVARRLDISGRSKMDKDDLVSAIEKANRRETRRSRS
ncbi:hypothetical protein GCM10027535_17710 [Mycolicibacterium hippocampi]|uniref:Rho termination factor N-terminal domain-containing protein n=1 Tax=Mycolicibacterium hippocampi TaxID=659824 RepID=A0A7I9ZHP4_9MYCO|nr:hypothetical protein MHIP_10280 [Mycolicibacterium hippocampi]